MVVNLTAHFPTANHVYILNLNTFINIERQRLIGVLIAFPWRQRVM